MREYKITNLDILPLSMSAESVESQIKNYLNRTFFQGFRLLSFSFKDESVIFIWESL